MYMPLLETDQRYSHLECSEIETYGNCQKVMLVVGDKSQKCMLTMSSEQFDLKDILGVKDKSQNVDYRSKDSHRQTPSLKTDNSHCCQQHPVPQFDSS